MIFYFISILICLVIAIPAALIMNKKSSASPQATNDKQFQRLEREKAKQEKQQQQKAQAEKDIDFYRVQYDRILEITERQRAQYKKAAETLNRDLKLNQYSVIIPLAQVEKDIKARDKTQKQLILLENQLHALEKKIAAAENILRG